MTENRGVEITDDRFREGKVVAAHAIRQAIEDLAHSQRLRQVRETALWMMTEKDCSGGCRPDSGDFNCLCCFLGLNSGEVAERAWRQIPAERRVTLLSELILSGCHF